MFDKRVPQRAPYRLTAAREHERQQKRNDATQQRQERERQSAERKAKRLEKSSRGKNSQVYKNFGFKEIVSRTASYSCATEIEEENSRLRVGLSTANEKTSL